MENPERRRVQSLVVSAGSTAIVFGPFCVGDYIDSIKVSLFTALDTNPTSGPSLTLQMLATSTDTLGRYLTSNTSAISPDSVTLPYSIHIAETDTLEDSFQGYIDLDIPICQRIGHNEKYLKVTVSDTSEWTGFCAIRGEFGSWESEYEPESDT